MLISIKLDEVINKDLFNYINSFKEDNKIIDYNSILIDLLNKGLANNLKKNIQDNIVLQINDEIKNIIKDELNSINLNINNNNIIESINKTSNTLNLILNKLDNTSIITNINNNMNENKSLEVKSSEYEKHLNENKKEINIDVDINPLLMNILNNANK